MRTPDSQTFELGHWESMIVSRALAEFEGLTMNDVDYTQEQIQHVKELAQIFALGTHTVTQKLESQ